MHITSISAAIIVTALGLSSVKATTVYQNNFNSGSASLAGFTSSGTATVQVTNGQLETDVTEFNQGGVVLNTTSLSGYKTTLAANAGMVTWAFNVSNMDGYYNNGFNIILASNSADPLNDSNSAPSAEGYVFSGGEFVGNRMLLTRFDQHANNGQILVDVPDASGLGPLPTIGAVRITYQPSTNLWSVYMTKALTATDPTMASTFLGSATDGTYTHTSLPYFGLGGETTGSDYYDNLSISVVPEPSSIMWMGAGAIALFAWMWGSRKLGNDS